MAHAYELDCGGRRVIYPTFRSGDQAIRFLRVALRNFAEQLYVFQ